jgi:ABC-type Fe2+-enterobactin transport system substrate-binding protein
MEKSSGRGKIKQLESKKRMSAMSEILEQSGMSVADFAYALDVRYTRMVRMLQGAVDVPQGIVSDAHQLLADIDYVKAAMQADPALAEISYKVFKTVLDTSGGADYSDDMKST